MNESANGHSFDDCELNYRDRIYRRYVNARPGVLAPANLDGLRLRVPYLTKLIGAHFPLDRDAAIIDLGCGHGALIHVARQMGYRNVLGVDRSPEQVSAARDLGIDGVREGDLVETVATLPSESKDVVVTFDVIEHFRKDELIGFVDQVLRILRPGGRWIIHAPNGESPFGARMRYWDFTHELAFTRLSISQLMLSSGFAGVDCYEDSPVPHGLKSSIRWLLWKGIRSGLRLWLAAETGVTARDAIFSQNLLAVATKPPACVV
jgi:2-polyprenyl-3-methyl-5-hydroxy-6-metoxy-1,4-benzoquinol methylase